MSWKRFAAAGFALCALATVSSAQGAPGPGGTPQGGMREGMGRGMQALWQGIELTDAQKTRVAEINEKYRAEMQSHRAAHGGAGGEPAPEMRKMMADMQAKRQAELRAVLTADQQVIFDKNLAEMKARRAKPKAVQSTE